MAMHLFEALGVRPGDVIALTGGGGKTSALYTLGRELAAAGLPVLLTGTTRFTPPERMEPPGLTIIDASANWDSSLDLGLWPRTVATGHGNKGRLLPVTPDWIDELHLAHPGWTIVIEADGSAMRPFKAPAAHEPVVPPSTSLLVSVVGIDAAGRPLDETHVHRPEIVAALAGSDIGGYVDADVIARVLLHEQGGRKGLPPGARWSVLINKADTPERLTQARLLADLLQGPADRVVIARLRDDSPVIDVL
ncbi:MAG: putative selenium-dependent hydroxylase accessory protein YqeC [Chloroflexi bacterium]|nr:putative selenium-dependent hydroxylase accessory protein YqeC [Chloroflexota bacterium]